MVKNIIKKASNGKVFKVRKFRIVERRNFDIWAIAIRSHLEGRSCARSTKILYSEYCLADYAPKTASYEKMFYMDCLRLVETIDFDIKIVSIRVRMQPGWPKEKQRQKLKQISRTFRPNIRPNVRLIGKAFCKLKQISRTFRPNIRPNVRLKSDVPTLPPTLRDAIFVRVRLGFGLLVGFPGPFLVREVHPPHIYVRGDGRLNNTQSNKSSTIFYLFYLLPLFFFFLVLRSFFLLQGGEPRGPRGGQADLGQPIAAARPDGVPPGRVGFRVYKSARRIVLRTALPAGLLRRELRCITPGVEGTR
jgi:hypothetical protein